MDNLPFATEPFLTGKPLEVWLDSMDVEGWSINDGLVDVAGDVDIRGKLGELKRLPVRFGKAGGNFWLCNNQLVSLEGVPKEVGGWFSCDHNRIVSLDGAPNKVGGNFNCVGNQLVSLEGAPKQVGGSFSCSNNKLVSLDGTPKQVGGGFYCYKNQLVSLDGGPKKVSGDFWCYNNQLVSLEGSPERVGGWFGCRHNLLVDFKGMEGISIGGNLIVTDRTEAGQDNVFVSLEGLPKELYDMVEGLDIQALLAVESQHSDIPDIEI